MKEMKGKTIQYYASLKFCVKDTLTFLWCDSYLNICSRLYVGKFPADKHILTVSALDVFPNCPKAGILCQGIRPTDVLQNKHG